MDKTTKHKKLEAKGELRKHYTAPKIIRLTGADVEGKNTNSTQENTPVPGITRGPS